MKNIDFRLCQAQVGTKNQSNSIVDFHADHMIGAIAIVLNKFSQATPVFVNSKSRITTVHARRHDRAKEAQNVV